MYTTTLMMIIISITTTVIATIDHDQINYPYKPIFELPQELSPNEETQQMFVGCRHFAKDYWSTKVSQYYTISKSFCCFVWKQLACEVKVVNKWAKSNAKASNFSRLLEATTREMFEPFCINKGGYGPYSWSCYYNNTDKYILIAVLIGATALTSLCIYCVGPMCAITTVLIPSLGIFVSFKTPDPLINYHINF